MLERITSTDPDLRMPPEGKPLSATEAEKIKAWIEAGAEWPVHWAYQELAEPDLPELNSPELEEWCQTPIDYFIVARLQEAGLSPSPLTDRVTLIRRVTYDLTGLPPHPLKSTST
ncbi:MAG: DUF1549 domain-containing protein [Planctomycetaceae bacterium]